MKKIPALGTLVAALAVALCCLGPVLWTALGLGTLGVTARLFKQPAVSPPLSSAGKSRTVLVSISGMTCIICAKGIEAHLRQTPGVYDAQVSFDKKKALVCYNPRQLSKNDIEKHIGETGYSGAIISETLCAKPGLSGKNLQ